MKVPFSWLKDFVDIDCTPEELEKKLFSCGFEVEERYKFCKDVDKIVVCKIEKIEKHPNADKLSVCSVDAGEYGKLQIITAATNVFEGALVPVALDGATLYSGEKIKKGNLRGLPSNGMFCSGEELGINDDWYKGASVYGILILTENYPLGASVTEILGLNDVMFDINVTANRPDCQSIFGVAREVAAVLDKPLKQPDFEFKTSGSLSTVKTVKIENKAFDLCQRYKGRLVSNIKIEESPLWLKRRLVLMGIRPINNIVDVTNYVLTEIGQPMHAFDLAELDGNAITVRRAEKGEKIVTLDEKEFALNENNLVIADGVKPVALAGVMGGLNSGIKDTTKNVVFESARFSRDNIRKTARSLGQRSDSSARFEKGVDFSSVELGMARALNLICELKCGEIALDEYDLFDGVIAEKTIATEFSKVNGVLGIDVPKDIIVNTLKKLNFKVDCSGEKLNVTVPLFREDMEDYPDIAEEIIREIGYDNITPTLLKTSAITNGGRNDEQKHVEDMKSVLTGFGCSEIISYSFVSEKEFDVFGLNKDKMIKILNPISEDMAVMRTSLLPSILRTVVFNINRKNLSGRLFEIAKVYNAKSIPLEELPVEETRLSLAVFGDNEDFFSVKGIVEGVLDAFCRGVKVKFVKSEERFMHPTRAADIYIGNTKIGFVGQIHPEIVAKIGGEKPIFGAELDYEKLTDYFTTKIVASAVSKFPTVERDLAVIIDENVPYDDVKDCIESSGGKLLRSVKLFDVYQGNQVAKDKKSMAFNLIFVSDERTLNVEEIESAIRKILKNLKEKLNAELR